MSIESWLKEFMPIDAKEASKLSDTEMLDWCIKKFEGCLSKNLRKHDLRSSLDHHLESIGNTAGVYEFGTWNCPLCIKYLNTTDCTECPLYLAREDVRCDEKTDTEKRSPWEQFHTTSPLAMLKCLEKARRWVQKREQQKRSDCVAKLGELAAEQAIQQPRLADDLVKFSFG